MLVLWANFYMHIRLQFNSVPQPRLQRELGSYFVEVESLCACLLCFGWVTPVVTCWVLWFCSCSYKPPAPSCWVCWKLEELEVSTSRNFQNKFHNNLSLSSRSAPVAWNHTEKVQTVKKIKISLNEGLNETTAQCVSVPLNVDTLSPIQNSTPLPLGDPHTCS